MIKSLKIVRIKPQNLIKTTKCAKLSTNALANVKLDSVHMSFASYETTGINENTEVPPPLIVMHGLFGSKANWNSLCKAFHQKTEPRRKILAVDARNHGDSPHCTKHTYPHLAQDIRTFYAQHRLNKAALLGHSMGGRAVMYFALKYPDLVDKLIIGDISPITTSPNLNSMPSLFAAVQNVNLPTNVPLSSARLSADMQLSKNITDKGLRSFLLTNLIQKGDGSYAWRVNIPALLANFNNNIARFPHISNLTFNGPVLFVAGGVSDYIQKTDHVQILKMFPNAEFKVIDGAGHWVHSEKPNEFLQICTEFLNKKTKDL